MKTFSPDEIDASLPEVVKQFLASGRALEEIKLHANGSWTHEGLDFENPRIKRLFFRSVARTEGGTWVLDIPPFTYPIEVEETAYFVERVAIDEARHVTLSLSDETKEELDASTLEYAPGGKLTCAVKGGSMRARFLRQAYYTLAELATADKAGRITLELDGTRVELGELEDET